MKRHSGQDVLRDLLGVVGAGRRRRDGGEDPRPGM